MNLLQLIEGNLGNIGYMRGDYAIASKHYNEAIKFAIIINEEPSLVEWYKNLAQVLYEQGNIIEAFDTIEVSEAIARKINSNNILVELMIRKGIYYTFLNQRDYAQKIFNQVFKLASVLNMTDQKYRAKVSIGEIMEENQKYEMARKYFQEYTNYLKKKGDLLSMAYWIGKIANTYFLEKHYKLAKQYYSKAFETAKQAKSKPYTAWYLLKIADMDVIAGDIEQAIQKYNTILKTATEENNTNMLWWIFTGLGDAHKKANDLKTAISQYLHAAKIIEKSRTSLNVDQLRIGYFSQRISVYEKLMDCYLERFEDQLNYSDLDSLFYFSELSRSRSLKEQLGGSGFHSENDEYISACNKLRSSQRRLRQMAGDVNKRANWDELLSQLEKAKYSLLSQQLHIISDDQFSANNGNLNFKSLSLVQKILNQAGFGLLLYHISDATSFVLVAANEDVKVVRLNAKPFSLDSLIHSLMAPMHLVNEDSVQMTPFKAGVAHQLYKLLVEPAEKVLDLPMRIVIVPDIVLMNLPLEMLLVQSPDKPEYTSLDSPAYAANFLLNRYTMVYTPSTSLLQETSKSFSGNPNVLVFANPFGESSQLQKDQSQLRFRTGWRFEPLIFVQQEANGIQSVHTNTHVYARDQATKKNLQQEAPRHQVIHFATHAFADTTFDAFSGLVLAVSEDSTDDGLLMGYEISDLNLNCDLVTLSACETGRGKLVSGEGVMGLPRLFLGAGAKSVLMTQWKVDDKFASELMPEFYRYYLKEGRSKADALGQAKRNVLKKQDKGVNGYYQHPFFWASFTLYGDPGQERKPMDVPLVVVLSVILILTMTAIIYIRKKRSI